MKKIDGRVHAAGGAVSKRRDIQAQKGFALQRTINTTQKGVAAAAHLTDYRPPYKLPHKKSRRTPEHPKFFEGKLKKAKEARTYVFLNLVYDLTPDEVFS